VDNQQHTSSLCLVANQLQWNCSLDIILSNRDDLRTTHEEADVTVVYQVLNIAQSGAQSIKVISDDIDVFLLLMHFGSEQKLCCRLIMEATSSERASVDICKHL